MNLPSFHKALAQSRSLELERRSLLVLSFPLQTDALLATSAAPCCQGAQVAREYLHLLHLRQPATNASAQKHQCGETGRLCAARGGGPSGISHPSGISSSPPPLPGGAAGFGGVGVAAGFGGAAFGGGCSLFHWKRQNRLIVSNQQTSVATNGQGRTFICSIFDSLSAKRVSTDKKDRLACGELAHPSGISASPPPPGGAGGPPGLGAVGAPGAAFLCFLRQLICSSFVSLQSEACSA